MTIYPEKSDRRHATLATNCVVVLGMHRSGTSAFAGLLRLLGVDLGDHLMPGREDENKRGFFENLDIFDFHERLLFKAGKTWHDLPFGSSDGLHGRLASSFQDELVVLLSRLFGGSRLWGVKDPRLCLMLPLWLPVLDQLGCKPHFILVHRHPGRVLESLAKRDGFSANKAACLWLEHTLAAERNTRSYPRTFVPFEDLLEDPIRISKAVGEALNLEWPRQPREVAGPIRQFVVPGGQVAGATLHGTDISAPFDELTRDLDRLLRSLTLKSGGNSGRDFDALATQQQALFADPVQKLVHEHTGQAQRDFAARVVSTQKILVERTDWIRLLDERLNGLGELVAAIEALARDDQHWRALDHLRQEVNDLSDLTASLVHGLDAVPMSDEHARTKLVMTLLVRDEEDIIDAHLRYHFSQGVDHVIVTDNLSVDRTSEILAKYESEGRLSVIREETDDYSQAEWVTRMARSAYLDHDADWVINSDADEFWLPLKGDLKSTLAAMRSDVSVVSAPRTNFVPVHNNGAPFYERMLVRETASLNALGAPLENKVCHRGDPSVEVWQGNHGVTGMGAKALEGPSPMLILHFPLRSYEQFENKIVKGGRAYERNTKLDPGIGDAWRRLYDLYREGGLQDHYGSCEQSATEMEEGLREGSLVRDERLRRFLQSLDDQPGAVVSDLREAP